MNKTKTVSLNISERVAALGILNEFKGNLDKLAVVLNDIKFFTISDEEWEKAGRVVEQVDGTSGSQWRWSDEKGGDKEITLDMVVVDYLREVIKTKSDKGELSLQDKALLSLSGKIN